MQSWSWLLNVLSLQTAAVGNNVLATLRTKNALATLLAKMGHLNQARHLYEEVLQAHTEQLGPHHSETITTQLNLASALHGLGLRQEALCSFRVTLVLVI